MYQWFKFYGSEFLSDPKIVPLNAGERSCWITLLCLASQTENGVLKFISEQQIKMMSGILPETDLWKTTNGIFEKLQKLDMVTLGNGIVTINNWAKRQVNPNTLRVREWRMKQKGNANETTEREKDRKKEYSAKADFRESPKTTAKETADNLKRLMQ